MDRVAFHSGSQRQRRAAFWLVVALVAGLGPAKAAPPPLPNQASHAQSDATADLSKHRKPDEPSDAAAKRVAPSCSGSLCGLKFTDASHFYVEIDPATKWQPRDGHVVFTITTIDGKTPSDLDNVQVSVSFGWPDASWAQGKTARISKSFPATFTRILRRTNESITFETTFPDDMWAADTNAPTATNFISDKLNALGLKAESTHIYDGWGLIPQVNMRVVTRSRLPSKPGTDPNTSDTVVPIGISVRVYSVLLTIVMVGVALFLLHAWARWRGVMGDFVLRVISTKDGYASLSGFQILLWTLVIFGGAVFVMAITGSLIDVPTQMLALLGISGFSALSSTIAAQRQPDASAPTVAVAYKGPLAPGSIPAVQSPRVVSQAAGQALVYWSRPVGGIETTSYDVTLLTPVGAGPIIIGQRDPLDTFAAISGLPAAACVLQLVANGAGNAASPAVTVTIPATAAVPAAPAIITAFAAKGSGKRPIPELTWQVTSSVEAYLVQYREVGAPVWTTLDPIAGFSSENYTAVLPQVSLEFEATYEFRSASILDGALGPWSNVAAVTTDKHIPEWSDLVMSDDGISIDITRVQMLLFTVLAAMFVALNIGDDSIIPIIPNGMIMLIGLSNGVYVGAKFVNKPQ